MQLALNVSVASALWLIALMPDIVQAQTQGQIDRLDELSQFAVAGPMCAKLGFRIATDIGARLDPTIKQEIETWPGDQSQLQAAATHAIERQTKVFSSDLNFYSDHAKSERALRNVKIIMIKYGKVCLRATKDNIFKNMIVSPEEFDLERAATIASDKMLEEGGLASWQTPKITARGDMMMIAGGCRHVIGPELSDELVAKYGRSEITQERNFYRRSFDTGLTDSNLATFTLHECKSAIGNYERQLSKINH